MGSLVEAVDCS